MTFLLPRWGGSCRQVENFIGASRRQGAPKAVIQQLQAILCNDMGQMAVLSGRRAEANDYFLDALELGYLAGGTFSREFVSVSRHHACHLSSAAPYCR